MDRTGGLESACVRGVIRVGAGERGLRRGGVVVSRVVQGDRNRRGMGE